MVKQRKKVIFARIFAIIGLLAILASAAIAVLAYTPLQILKADDIIGYAVAGSAALGFILVSVAFLLVILDGKARKKEEKRLLASIAQSSSGEKLLVDETGEYCVEIAKTINRTRLLKERVKYNYGVYKESRFDEIVLGTLEEEVTAKAGLAYFILSGDAPVKSKGPRDALLYMIQAHFGEHCFYGRVQNGIAVFMPFLTSKEEFLGRIRRTVQLYSYTEEGNHISAKAGVAFYPDYAPRNLTAQVMKATLENLSLNVHSVEECAPHLGYDAAEEEAFLLHKMRFLDAITRASTPEAIDSLYRDFVLRALPYLSSDSVGVLLYKEEMGDYELLVEEAKEEGASFSLLAENGRIGKDMVDPFLEWSIQEKGNVSANEAIFLPTKLSSLLDALHVPSIAVRAVTYEEKPIGLIFATGKEKNRYLDNRSINEFLEASYRYLLMRRLMMEEDKGQIREEILLSSFDHYAYGVAKDSYSLSYVSPNLAKAVPEAKVGATCYKVLFGSKKPCKNCPLLENNVEKMMPRLASGVFAYKTVQGQGETMLILSHHRADFSPSRIDPLTGLLSDKSLHEDLQSEILLKDSTGIVLSFRIRNVDPIARLVRVSYDEVVKGVGDALFSAGLGRGLYRNGPTGFAYLLPFASRQEGISLAEKVCRTFSAKVDFHERQVEFVLDYVLVSYPLEAETPFALDAILRILYQRADASSRGRLFEVNNEKGRLVDIDFYMRTKLEEGLRGKKLPLRFNRYEELAGKHIAFLEARLSLNGEDGNPIEPRRVELAAATLNKGSEVYESMANTLARFLGAKRKEIASSSLHGAILRIDSSCFSEEFIRSVATMLDNNKASRSHLFLEVDEKDMKEASFATIKAAAKAHGIAIGIGGYKGGMEGYLLRDYAYVSFAASSVYGVDKKDFLLALSNVRRVGLNVLIKDYRDSEEKRYLSSLNFHYGKKEGEEPLAEEDVAF